jgi:hypothetical protein
LAPDSPNGAIPCGTKVNRAEFANELQNPKLIQEFAGRMKTEVGSQGNAAQIAFAETIFNRAAARHQTLEQTLWGRYFPTSDPGQSDNPLFFKVINKVFTDGTNISLGATGNASGTVGFGGCGRETAKFGGERFGVECQDIHWKQTFIPLSCDTPAHDASTP